MVKVGRVLWKSSGLIACSSTTYNQVPKTMSRGLLNMSKYGDSTASVPVNLSQCLVSITVKKCFLIFNGTS